MDVPAIIAFVRDEIAKLQQDAGTLPRGRKARRLIDHEIARLEEIIAPPLDSAGACKVCGSPIERP